MRIVAAVLMCSVILNAQAEDYPKYVDDGSLPTADGFRGIWYANQPSDDEYKFKYSGGLATYPQQHTPIAVHAPKVDKTFFVYGGRYPDRNRLLHMISYYDHKTGKLARPRILLDKQTDDAHDNPVLSIDDEGYLYIFSNAHGTARPSYIHRSKKPYDITAFERLVTTNFSYGQPWYLPSHGFVFLHTLYHGGRMLHVSQSDDGENWTEPMRLAGIAQGQYQMSRPFGDRVGTAFNYHPAGKGLNWRTNLYYMQSSDGGKTWKTITGEKLADLPLTQPDNPARIAEYESKKRLVYIKDMDYTPDGRPVLLYLTSEGYQSGPENDPRILKLTVWTGDGWRTHEITRKADNNYDYGSLYIEDESNWRIIATLGPAPQRYNTGGEMFLLTSNDAGRTWKTKQLTKGSKLNHNYPRRPLHAHPGFYALWADGHGREASKSRLYFCTREGEIFRMPEHIEGDQSMVAPEPYTP